MRRLTDGDREIIAECEADAREAERAWAAEAPDADDAPTDAEWDERAAGYDWPAGPPAHGGQAEEIHPSGGRSMSEAKHTPGPWRAECEKWPLVRDGNKWWRVYAGDSDMVAEVGRHADAKPDEIAEDAANAHLIAAAPDLLAELRETADWLTERAAVLRRAVASQVRPAVKTTVCNEAAKLEGRAAVIRQTILNATQGA